MYIELAIRISTVLSLLVLIPIYCTVSFDNISLQIWELNTWNYINNGKHSFYLFHYTKPFEFLTLNLSFVSFHSILREFN